MATILQQMPSTLSWHSACRCRAPFAILMKSPLRSQSPTTCLPSSKAAFSCVDKTDASSPSTVTKSPEVTPAGPCMRSANCRHRLQRTACKCRAPSLTHLSSLNSRCCRLFVLTWTSQPATPAAPPPMALPAPTPRTPSSPSRFTIQAAPPA